MTDFNRGDRIRYSTAEVSGTGVVISEGKYARSVVFTPDNYEEYLAAYPFARIEGRGCLSFDSVTKIVEPARKFAVGDLVTRTDGPFEGDKLEVIGYKNERLVNVQFPSGRVSLFGYLEISLKPYVAPEPKAGDVVDTLEGLAKLEDGTVILDNTSTTYLCECRHLRDFSGAQLSIDFAYLPARILATDAF